jgi:glutaredoxin 3
VKEFLRAHGITYTDRNIASDEDAVNDLQKLGWMTTPVTVVDGQTVVGFDERRLKDLLGIA